MHLASRKTLLYTFIAICIAVILSTNISYFSLSASASASLSIISQVRASFKRSPLDSGSLSGPNLPGNFTGLSSFLRKYHEFEKSINISAIEREGYASRSDGDIRGASAERKENVQDERESEGVKVGVDVKLHTGGVSDAPGHHNGGRKADNSTESKGNNPSARGISINTLPGEKKAKVSANGHNTMSIADGNSTTKRDNHNSSTTDTKPSRDQGRAKPERPPKKRKLSVAEKIAIKYKHALSWKGAPLQTGHPQWQQLDTKRNAFVYSAHFDDVEFPPLVRIVGIAVAVNLSYHNVTCRFYDGHDNTSVHFASGLLHHFRGRNGRNYIGAFVDCPLPEEMTSLPFAVSVFRANDSAETNYKIINYSHSDSWLKQHNNSESLRKMLQPKNNGSVSSLFDEIQRKRSEDQWRWNVTRCFIAFQGGYNKHVQLADTVAASRALGVERFVFYVESAGPELLRMLKVLEEEGVAEVYPWNMHLYSNDLFYMAQFSAIQECLYRHLWSSRYLLFGDVDELFVPRKELTLMPFLERHFQQRPVCGAFQFLHTVYNCHVATQRPPAEVDPAGYAAAQGLISLTHVLREDRLYRPNDRSKIVLDPHKVSVGSVHVVGKMRPGFKQCVMPREEAFLHHYRCFQPLPPEHQLNDPYLWQVGPAIIKQVQHFMHKYNNTVLDQPYP